MSYQVSCSAHCSPKLNACLAWFAVWLALNMAVLGFVISTDCLANLVGPISTRQNFCSEHRRDDCHCSQKVRPT